MKPDDEKIKEQAAYLMQKSEYHEFEPEVKKSGKQIIQRIQSLNAALEIRKAKSSLDIQELSTNFT